MKHQKLNKIFIKLLSFVTMVNLIVLPSNFSSAENEKDKPICGPKYCCPPDKICYKISRGGKIVIITPISGELLLNSRPTFTFDNKENELYRITLKLMAKNMPLWETQTNENKIIYPQNRNELKHGLYTLTVNHNSILKYVPFSVASKERIEETEKEIENIKNKYRDATDLAQKTEKILEITKYYRQNQIITEARKTLEEALSDNIKTPAIYFQLADINRKMEHWEGSIKLLQEVNKQINQPSFEAAQAQQFIAEVYFCGKKDKINSIDWFQKAKETYQQLGKSEYVKGMTNNLNQMKDSNNQTFCKYN